MGLSSFVWSEIKDKDEIGKGSFGLVMKGTYAPKGKVVVKQCLGEGDSYLRNIAKEAKMLESLCHLNIMHCIGICILKVYTNYTLMPSGLFGVYFLYTFNK